MIQYLTSFFLSLEVQVDKARTYFPINTQEVKAANIYLKYSGGKTAKMSHG